MDGSPHLHVVVSVEGLAADGAGELRRTNEDLGRGGDPVLPLCEPPYPQRRAPHPHRHRAAILLFPFPFLLPFFLQLLPSLLSSSSSCRFFLVVVAAAGCCIGGAGAGQADVQGNGDLPGCLIGSLCLAAAGGGGDDLVIFLIVVLMGVVVGRGGWREAEEGEGFPDGRGGGRWVVEVGGVAGEGGGGRSRCVGVAEAVAPQEIGVGIPHGWIDWWYGGAGDRRDKVWMGNGS